MRVMVLVGLVVLASGCKKPARETPPLPAPEDARRVEPVKPKTPAELVKRYQECVGFYGAAKWDDFRGCYAPGTRFDLPGLAEQYVEIDLKIEDSKRQRRAFPDARVELELVIGGDSFVISIARITGTSSGVDTSIPAGTKVAFRVANYVEYDGEGRAKSDRTYFDAATVSSPLGARMAPPRSVILPEENDRGRLSNAVIEVFLGAWDETRTERYRELLADDLVWFEPALDRTFDKASFIAHTAELRDAVRGLRFESRRAWFVGDYVAVAGLLEATPIKPMPSLGIDRWQVDRIKLPVFGIFKADHGKVTWAWWFWQRSALNQSVIASTP